MEKRSVLAELSINKIGECMPTEHTAHWFANKQLDVYLFRLNRRPLIVDQEMLFLREYSDTLSHAAAVLELSTEVEYGRHKSRTWKIGNLERTVDGTGFSGRLGSTRTDPAIGQAYNESDKTWNDTEILNQRFAVTPFAFSSDGRILAVVAHPEITPETMSAVVSRLLNQGERQLAMPTTDWGVDPILDEQDFLDWIVQTDTITKVKFVFERPNPDGAEDLEDMMDRLDHMKAASISEEIKAKDPDQGLDKAELTQDKYFRRFVSAAARSWARATATGRSNNQTVKYKQSESVALEKIAKADESWDGITSQTINAARRGRRKLG